METVYPRLLSSFHFGLFFSLLPHVFAFFYYAVSPFHSISVIFIYFTRVDTGAVLILAVLQTICCSIIETFLIAFHSLTTRRC